MNDPFDTVQTLRDLGMCVIPSGGKEEGKSPDLPSWKQYQKALPTDSICNTWLLNKKPSLWGIVTGEVSGVVVVGCDNPEAVLIMGDLKPHVRTPRGGNHYYFAYPGHSVKTKVGILPKIDIRADGGFANVIGTNPKTGGEYKIEIMPTPETIYSWDKMPKELLEKMNSNEPAVKPEPTTPIMILGVMRLYQTI